MPVVDQSSDILTLHVLDNRFQGCALLLLEDRRSPILQRHPNHSPQLPTAFLLLFLDRLKAFKAAESAIGAVFLIFLLFEDKFFADDDEHFKDGPLLLRLQALLVDL